MSVNTKAIIRKGTTIESLVNALELKYSNVIVTSSSYDNLFFSITFYVTKDVKRRLSISYHDTVCDHGVDGVWMSLGCHGDSVDIMRYLCEVFGGYLDENDCDDDGFYPINFHLFTLTCDDIVMCEFTNKIVSRLGYNNLKEALGLFKEYKSLKKQTKMETKINENDSIDIVFADGEKTATASIPYKKLKELLLEDAYETITTPNCGCSSCAENNFCECDPINEDMEFAGMFLSAGK